MPILSPEINDNAAARRVLLGSEGARPWGHGSYMSGELAETVSDNELRDLFREYGAVSRASIVRHKHSGKSAGYGFVEMSSGEQTLNAAVALGSTAFGGHSVRLYITPSVAQNSQPPSSIPQEH